MKKKLCLLLSCMLCIMGISNVSASEDKVNGIEDNWIEFPEQIVSNQKNYITAGNYYYGIAIEKVYYQQVEISKETYDELKSLISSLNSCYEANANYMSYVAGEDRTLLVDKKHDELELDMNKKCELRGSNDTKLKESVPKYDKNNWVETKKEVIDGKNKYEISASSYSYGVYYVKLVYEDGDSEYKYVIYSSSSTSTSTTETEVKTDTKTETTTEVKENTVKNPKTGMNNIYLVLPVVAGVGVLAFLATRRKNKFPQA